MTQIIKSSNSVLTIIIVLITNLILNKKNKSNGNKINLLFLREYYLLKIQFRQEQVLPKLIMNQLIKTLKTIVVWCKNSLMHLSRKHQQISKIFNYKIK